MLTCNGRCRPSRLALACGVACAAAVVSCAPVAVRNQGDMRPIASAFVVVLEDGSRFEGTPLHIQLMEDSEVAAQASITAHAADGRTWSALVGLSLVQVRRASVSLQRRPLAEGVGMVGLIDPDDRLQTFDGGTLAFALGGAHIAEGRATTLPVNGSATFSGRYVLSCWVLPQTLGQKVDGDGDGEVRIQDVGFTSAFCRQFADLR